MKALLIVVASLLVIACAGATAGTTQTQPRTQTQTQRTKTGTLVSFSGRTEKSSPSFSVPEGCTKFTVHWKARGDGSEINMLQVIAVNENTGREDYIVSVDDFGQVADGTDAQPLKAGSYYLRTYVVNNSWDVTAGCE